VILDVRSRVEFANGHVPGARHIPFWRISRRIDAFSIPPHAELVVYCGHGPRARVAGRTLRRKGFTRITYLEGHFSRWHRAGFREEK
jgi:rhodanese-related sulfurtransferase